MKSLLASLTLLAAGLLAFAAGPPTTPVVLGPRANDQLDYLFLAGDRPTMIRVHARMGERPYDAPWVEFMDRLFTWFDKDRDGSLSAEEAARLPHAQALMYLSQGQIVQDNRTLAMASIDTNKDGKVSREELRDYYRAGGVVGYRIQMNGYQAAAAKQVNNSIYKRLDKAGEGHLSAAKVAGLYEKLRGLDGNEDEMLDETELNTGAGANNGYGQVLEAPTGAYRPLAVVAEPNLLDNSPGQEASLVKQILDKYDRNKDGKLTRAEIGLAAATFEKLDADKDGTLGAAELRAYLTSEPDIVLRIQIGTTGTGGGRGGLLSRIGFAPAAVVTGPRLEIVNEKTLGEPLKKTLRRAGRDDFAVDLGDTRFSLQVNAPQPGGNRRFNNAKNYYLQIYDQTAGKKGYVEKADNKGQQPYLFQVFPQADRNADGKLTRIELIDWLDFTATAQDANMTFTVNDLGRGIFPVLDADGDGRLSLREMKTAWDRLKPLAKGGKLTQADLPRTLRVSVGQGGNNNNNFVPVAINPYGMPAARPLFRGSAPTWFKKMDRNNDGDLSPREWLGTEEEFAKIDADGDGLISAAEATRFDAKK